MTTLVERRRERRMLTSDGVIVVRLGAFELHAYDGLVRLVVRATGRVVRTSPIGRA